jgi:Dynamin family
MASPVALQQLRAYASEVSDCAEVIEVSNGLLTQRDELKGFAGEIIREIDAPLRIGFVGEFSAGKSLLLGVLVGQPSLLPVSSEPTTGNVTELRFMRADDARARTGIRRVQVRFFSRADLARLDECILAELREATAQAHLAEVDLASFEAASVRESTLRDWCAREWRRRDAGLNMPIRELILTRDAAAAAPDWLGRTISITQEQLSGVLEIRYPRLDDVFPAAPARASVPFSESPPEAHLELVFPLVDRVMLDIVLPPGAWPVSGTLGSDEFVLLDFPGIGGNITRSRDIFLTQRGLEDVHTILVLVNAGRAGGEAPGTFYRQLKDVAAGGVDADHMAEKLSGKIVYCAGRFDELPPPDLSGQDMLTVDQLINVCRPLNALLQSGHQPGMSLLGGTFASSVLAISRLGLNAPPGLGLEFRRPEAEAGAERWREVANSLRRGGTGRDLVRLLEAYATDGGISELRRLLDQHVRDNGLSLRTRRAQERLDVLDDRKAQFEQELRATSRAARDGAVGPAEQASSLMRDLRNRQKSLTTMISNTLRDPAMVMLAPRWSVRQDVTQKAADLVMAWPQWDEIFRCVQDGIVRPGAVGKPDDSWYDDEPTELPQRLSDFEPDFARTCEEMREYAQARALAGAEKWLRDCSATAEAAELRDKAARLLDAEVAARMTGKSLTRMWFDIGHILDSGSLATDLADRVGRAELDDPGSPSFPLRPKQLTSWAPGTPVSDGARHFIRVVRMRSTFIDSVTQYSLNVLDAIQGVIFRLLRSRYEGIRFRGSIEQRQFVAAVTGQPADTREKLPDPAGALAALERPDKAPESRG